MADLARTASAETAVSALDAALRLVAVRGRHYDIAAADALRERARVIAGRGAYGRARARRALAFADGLAQLPGESISRLYIARLGFASPRLQVPVAARGENRFYYVDFGLDDVDAFGEFDGKDKYADPEFLRGRTPQQALADEKEREDWIRGTSRRVVARWTSSHISSSDELGRRLRAFGIVPPG